MLTQYRLFLQNDVNMPCKCTFVHKTKEKKKMENPNHSFLHLVNECIRNLGHDFATPVRFIHGLLNYFVLLLGSCGLHWSQIKTTGCAWSAQNITFLKQIKENIFTKDHNWKRFTKRLLIYMKQAMHGMLK